MVPASESEERVSFRARMLATIRGEPTDLIPWAPRMDLWAIANRARGTLPPGLAGLDLAGIADAYGFGCRAVQADFYTNLGRTENLVLRPFGIESQPDFPFRVEVADLPVDFQVAGDAYRTTIHTGAGPVVTELTLTDEMIRDGSYDPYVSRRPIQTPDDIEPVAQVFEHLRVVPTPEGFAAYRDRIGERGLAVAQGLIGASPIHLVQHDLMELDTFIYLYYDDPGALHQLAARMEPFVETVLQTLLASEVEMFLWGSNYDQSVTWPDFFRDEIAPWLREVSQRAHARGKIVVTHADGEHHALLPHIPGCGFDVAESVCTRPMVRDSLAELRAGFGRDITLWGGIPSVALLESVMNDSVYESFLDSMFDELGAAERLILGVSDNVPPDAKLSRLAMIADRIRAFGPVRPALAGG